MTTRLLSSRHAIHRNQAKLITASWPRILIPTGAGPNALGSSIGTDCSMISSNHRCNYQTLAAVSSSSSLKPGSSGPGSLGSSLGTDSSMISSNHRCKSFQTLATVGSSNLTSISTTSTSISTISSSRKTPSIFSKRSSNYHYYHSSATLKNAAMEDEYGKMTSDGNTYVHKEPFVLESGQVLENSQLRFQTYGQINEARDNVIVVCHALTGNADLEAWWGGLLGSGKVFDTDRYLIVCANILGSCYGSSSPTSIDPGSGKAYGKDFPDISVKDTVRLQLLMLVNALKVKSIQSVIGGSFGGMQAMEFAVQAGSSWDSPYVSECFFSGSDDQSKQLQPLVRTVIPIACGAAHTAWQIAISETQRQAIYADPNWETDGLNATAGLSVARQIGMVSYRTPTGYSQKFGRDMQGPKKGSSAEADSADDTTTAVQYGSNANWKVKSYLKYQGEKFQSRFDPITYVKMTEQMDSHDVARGRNCNGSLQKVLSHVKIPALVMGIDSDILYPLEEQQQLADYLPNSQLKVITSNDGHDGFLLEQDQVAAHITAFLEQHE